jgi:uncharacterized membrane protein
MEKITRLKKTIINTYLRQNNTMNLKKIFGAILTVFGISGLIYTAVLFLNTSGNNHDIKTLIIYGILGFLFFSAGIGLVRVTNDE